MFIILQKLVTFSRFHKQLILLFVDIIALVGVLLVSFSLRLEVWYFPRYELMWLVFGCPLVAIPIFYTFNLYREVIRYIGFKALWAIVQAVTLYSLIWGIVGLMSGLPGIPRSVILINWLLAIIVIGGSRMVGRWVLAKAETIKNYDKCINVIIYGAGSAGRQLSIALTQSAEYNPVAFIDKKKELQFQSINGIKVIPRTHLNSLIESKNIKEVLLAIPSLTRKDRNDIIDFLEPFPVLVRSLPGVSELAQGKVKVADLYEVSVKDLLGRDSVNPNKHLLGKNINSKVVMVTGGGGSIGSELCRQIFKLKPKVLILYEQSEFGLYNIHKELNQYKNFNIKFYPILGSVNNIHRLNQTIKHFGVETIYHAAAYKHVPMVEFNISEGVSNNIFGTLACAQAAIKNNVETFVLISTDKAVRPTNSMGATKRFAEMILQALTVKQEVKNSEKDIKGLVKTSSKKTIQTCFSIVRFGNVLDSSGSVIPLFKEQINKGGPVTVTDENILRYFMTIPEAVELVIQAGAMSKGGDVFVLNMGEPVLIVDLARKMINLSGLKVKDKLNPEGDIEIQYTGLRPGEKLFEELLIGDNTEETDNSKILRANEEKMEWDDLIKIINELKQSVDDNNQNNVRKLLIKAVPGFKPQGNIQDLLYDN
jgi:FlaA1/EpsC-like NDP-sugar epimerase